MVMCICVRGPTLVRLAMATSGERSTWFPLEQLVEQERLPLHFSFFPILFESSNLFAKNYNFSKQLGPHGTFPRHYHFSILLALSKSSIHYLKQLLDSLNNLSMIL